MTPDEWQGYCHQLARLRHGEHNYQEVPDHDRGDLGIESFSVDAKGCVYQFYVAEAADTAGRYEAQRRKITVDLKKLEKNGAELTKLLGDKRIKRWILVVPEYDSKRIVEHAATKTAEIRERGLSHIDNDDFRVLVQDDSAFAKERATLLAGGVVTAPVAIQEILQEDVERWAVENASEVETLDEKLLRLIGHHPDAADQQAKLRREFLDYHLFGENYAEQLRSLYPELYETFVKEKTGEEEDLTVRSLITASVPKEHLGSVREQYEQRLRDRVPGLDTSDVRRLSWSGVAEWMIRCPLDFPSVTQ